MIIQEDMHSYVVEMHEKLVQKEICVDAAHLECHNFGARMRARMTEEDRVRWTLIHKAYVNGLYELMNNVPLKEYLLSTKEGEDIFSNKWVLRYQDALQHAKSVPAEGLSFYMDKLYMIGVHHAVSSIRKHGQEGYYRMALMAKKMLNGMCCEASSH